MIRARCRSPRPRRLRGSSSPNVPTAAIGRAGDSESSSADRGDRAASSGASSVQDAAVAWAPDVRVNAIAPGWIATPLTEALRAPGGAGETILARTPMGRWGEPEDLIGPALFLCSDAARFITGEVLRVDGGYLAA